MGKSWKCRNELSYFYSIDFPQGWQDNWMGEWTIFSANGTRTAGLPHQRMKFVLLLQLLSCVQILATPWPDSLEKMECWEKTEGRRRWDNRGWDAIQPGWHHWLKGHEFDQVPGDSEGQGSLVCCSAWGCKESDTAEWLNNNKENKVCLCFHCFPIWNYTVSLTT